jgi:hypothetical protein
LCAVLSVLTHLMALSTIAAVGLHALLFERRKLLARPWFLGALLVAGCVACLPYLRYLLHAQSLAGGFQFRLASFWFALLGGRTFSAVAAEYFYGPWWFWVGPGPAAWLVTVAVCLTAYAFLPTFYGMFLCVRGVWWRGQGERVFAAQFIALVAVGIHLALMLRYRLVSHPHYYNGVWFVFFALLCWGQSALENASGWRWAGRVYAASLAIALAVVVGTVHHYSGNRLRYGTSLGDQMESMREIQCYQAETPLYDERVDTRYGAIAALRRLVPCAGPAKKARELHLRYAVPGDIRDGRVVVIPVN